MPLQAMLQAVGRPAEEKINSSTHKLEWNCLYRMCTPSAKGVIKVDKEVYDKWNSNSGEYVESIRVSFCSSPQNARR